jgi:uncharacterized protein
MKKTSQKSDLHVEKKSNTSKIVIGVLFALFLSTCIVALWTFVIPSAKTYLMRKGTFTAVHVSSTAAALSSLVALLGFIAMRHRNQKESSQKDKDGVDKKIKILSANLVLFNPEKGCPAVGEVAELSTIGISRAFTESDTNLPADRVYISRDMDQELDTALKTSAYVLLVGESKSGKSRTAYEGVRRVFPNRSLVVPATPTSLETLISERLDLSQSVIWLDDLERYLVPQGMNDSVLNKLIAMPEVTIVATMQSRIHARYLPKRSTKPSEWRPLQSATHVRLNRVLTHSERVRASRTMDNAALEQYLGKYGLGEYLSAAPDLLNRFEDSRESLPSAWALVSAAIDLGRCGLDVMAAEAISNLAVHYLSAMGSDSSGLQYAWKWAQETIYGASALISKFEDGYRPFDYLVEYFDEKSEPIMKESWESALAVASESQLLSVANCAQSYREYHIAERALLRLSSTEDKNQAALGNFALGLLKLNLKRVSEATSWLQKSRKYGFPLASMVLGDLARRRRKTRQAETYYREAFESAPPLGAHELGDIAAQGGHRNDARDWYQRGARLGDGPCAAHMGYMELKEKNFVEAERSYRVAMERGVPNAIHGLADALVGQEKQEEAAALLILEAEGGTKNAAAHAAHHLVLSGDLIAAERWNRIAVERGEADAKRNLGIVLLRRGKRKEALSWLRMAYDEGDNGAAMSLANLLKSKGNFEEAERVLETAATAGRQDAEHDLGVLLMAGGRTAEARRWFTPGAKRGDPHSMFHLAIIERNDYLKMLKLLEEASNKGDALARTWLYAVKRMPRIGRFLMRHAPAHGRFSRTWMRLSLRYPRLFKWSSAWRKFGLELSVQELERPGELEHSSQ